LKEQQWTLLSGSYGKLEAAEDDSDNGYLLAPQEAIDWMKMDPREDRVWGIFVQGPPTELVCDSCKEVATEEDPVELWWSVEEKRSQKPRVLKVRLQHTNREKGCLHRADNTYETGFLKCVADLQQRLHDGLLDQYAFSEDDARWLRSFLGEP
jgi:hypothetical protein